MKFFLLIISALVLLFVDGTLTYGVFDLRTWGLADALILIITLALFCTLAWDTKTNKENHIPR